MKTMLIFTASLLFFACAENEPMPVATQNGFPAEIVDIQVSNQLAYSFEINSSADEIGLDMLVDLETPNGQLAIDANGRTYMVGYESNITGFGGAGWHYGRNIDKRWSSLDLNGHFLRVIPDASKGVSIVSFYHNGPDVRVRNLHISYAIIAGDTLINQNAQKFEINF